MLVLISSPWDRVLSPWAPVSSGALALLSFLLRTFLRCRLFSRPLNGVSSGAALASQFFSVCVSHLRLELPGVRCAPALCSWISHTHPCVYTHAQVHTHTHMSTHMHTHIHTFYCPDVTGSSHNSYTIQSLLPAQTCALSVS